MMHEILITALSFESETSFIEVDLSNESSSCSDAFFGYEEGSIALMVIGGLQCHDELETLS